MALFEKLARLGNTLLGYLTLGDTPRNQSPLHHARSTPITPSHINVNGKRSIAQSEGHGPNKRFKTSSGSTASVTPPSIRTNSVDLSDKEHKYEHDSEASALSEWDFINGPKPPVAEYDSPVHEFSKTKKLLSHFASPKYKRRLAQDKTNVQPDKEFDESDLKAFEIAKVLAKRQDEAQDMRRIGWAEDPIKVYLKLAMRGWEPLFPKTWKLSFDSFPQVLFAEKPEDEYIKAFSKNEFRAMKAFRSLVMIGSKARDATLPEVSTPRMRQPQELIRREIEKYMKWAFADAGVSEAPPTLAVISGPEDVDPELLEKKMIKRLTKLKADWECHNKLQTIGEEGGRFPVAVQGCPTPAVYGIIVSHLMICLVALEDEDDEPRIHAFSWNNMAKSEYDVWTTITIAILVMHCRNTMAGL